MESHSVPATKHDINKILMKLDEVQAQLDAITATAAGISNQLIKAKEEILAAVKALQDALAAALANTDVPQAVADSIAKLKGSVEGLSPIAQSLDDMNPDAPANPAI